MPLNEIALEELGLTPRWARKGAAGNGGRQAVEGGVASVDSDAASVATPALVENVTRTAAAPGGAPDARSARTSQRDAANAVAREEARVTGAQMPPPPPSPATAASDPADSGPPPDDDFAWFDAASAPAAEAAPPAEAAPAAEAAPFIEDVAEPLAARSPIATLDWDALAERVASCTDCRLCERRTNTVFGVGDRAAEWMLIGEAPGENEDRVGEPFVGQAGRLLDNMLRALTLARGENVYIANVIKCRPPGNRNPEPDEVARCEPYLQRQVQLVKPKIIVALGRFAAQSLLKTTDSIASLRGRVHEYEGVPVIVTYHPAYLLRSLHDKSKAWTDLCLARDTWRAASGHGR